MLLLLVMMSRTFASSLTLALALLATTGCSSSRPGGNGPDAAGVPADAAPFTSGTSTLAGAAEAQYVDGDRATARFSDPVNVAWGPDAKLYVADFDNSKIRVVDNAGNVTTVIDQKSFIRPYGLLFLADGTLIVSTDNDKDGNHTLMSGSVWKVDLHAGTATILANAIGRPRGLAELADGRVALSDEFHHVIRTLDVSTGAIADLAGTWDAKGMVDAVGAAARFSAPYGMIVRADGKLVVCDYDNSRLRLVAMDGTVTTLAGSVAGFADGAMAAAQFNHPQAIITDAAGELFVTDMDNFRIRKVSADTVETLAGDGTPGYLDADDSQTAELYGLEGIALNKAATLLYVADGNRGTAVPYNRIRQVKL